MRITIRLIILVFVAALLSCVNDSKQQNSSPNIEDETTVASEAQQQQGRQLFLISCAQCHHPVKDLAAPSLYGVRKRWKNKKLLFEYVRNSTAVIKKDKYAKDLFIKWNQVVMPEQPTLKDADITSIFDYVDGEAKKKGLM